MRQNKISTFFEGLDFIHAYFVIIFGRNSKTHRGKKIPVSTIYLGFVRKSSMLSHVKYSTIHRAY